jgi:DNA-binding transcriptional LysR family regulator
VDRFLMIEAFVRVAETRNFAEAARQIGVSNSVVTTRVQALESFVNAPLFHRNTRHVRLSEIGESVYRDSADLIAKFMHLTDHMRGLRQEPAGRLRVQMLPGFGIDYFGAILKDFTQDYPDIHTEIIVSDRVVDPIEDGLDITFQIFTPVSETLIARHIFDVRRLFCAAPSYLASHGAPEEPLDLLRHRTGVYLGYPTRNHWIFWLAGTKVEIDMPGHVRSNSVQLLRDYAVEGGGIVCLPTLVASRELVAGRLVPVLNNFGLSKYSFSAVYPQTQREAMKVRLLLDFLSSQFRDRALPPWDVPLFEKGLLGPDLP